MGNSRLEQGIMKATNILGLFVLGLSSLAHEANSASADSCKGVYCAELDTCFSTDGPFQLLGGPHCKAGRNHVYVYTTLHFEESDDGSQPEDECTLTAVAALDDETKSCIQKLEQRADVEKLIILVHGWDESDDVEWMDDKHTAIDDNDPNTAVIRVDWGPHDANDFLQDFADARYAGKAIGLLLDNIENQLGKRLYRHCVGFSLGGQVCGFVGEHANEVGRPLDRLSGVDPAGPLYNPDNTVFGNIQYGDLVTNPAFNRARLDKSDAMFVDVYHTDDIYVTTQDYARSTILPLGDVDFYLGSGPIFGGLQPGCLNPGKKFYYSQGSCNHHKATEFFAKSINNKGCQSSNACSGSPKGFNPKVPYPKPLTTDDFVSYVGCSPNNPVTAGYWAKAGTTGIYTITIDKEGNCLN